MSIIAINNAILQKLNEMQTLKTVYNYESPNPTGEYPYATLVIGEAKGQFATTAHNLRERYFTIRIRQEIMAEGQGDENSEQILIEVMDEMETAFDRDTTLSGICKFVRPATWTASYENNVHHMRLITINLEATEVLQVRP